DTVKAKFALKEDRWFYQADGDGEWRAIPQDAVQQDVQTPHSEPVLFVDATYLHAGPVCFFPSAQAPEALALRRFEERPGAGADEPRGVRVDVAHALADDLADVLGRGRHARRLAG